MNRRNFLKALTGGSIGVAIASVLPDSVIARQVSKRHADILVDTNAPTTTISVERIRNSQSVG